MTRSRVAHTVLVFNKLQSKNVRETETPTKKTTGLRPSEGNPTSELCCVVLTSFPVSILMDDHDAARYLVSCIYTFSTLSRFERYEFSEVHTAGSLSFYVRAWAEGSRGASRAPGVNLRYHRSRAGSHLYCMRHFIPRRQVRAATPNGALAPCCHARAVLPAGAARAVCYSAASVAC